jgi:hypothetical protein
MFHRYAQFQSFQTFNRVLSTSLRTGAPFKPFKSLADSRNGNLYFGSLGMRDRRRYLHWVFEAKKRFGLSVLNYMVTSNHVHLLVKDTGPDVIARSMQLHSVGHGIIMTP